MKLEGVGIGLKLEREVGIGSAKLEGEVGIGSAKLEGEVGSAFFRKTLKISEKSSIFYLGISQNFACCELVICLSGFDAWPGVDFLYIKRSRRKFYMKLLSKIK